MKMKRGWKVVSYDSVCRQLVSAIQDLEDGGVCYPVGAKTYPRAECGPLTVFTSKEAAQYFRNKLLFRPDCSVRACWYAPSSGSTVWYFSRGRKTEYSIDELVYANSSLIARVKDVALADAITLIRKRGEHAPA